MLLLGFLLKSPHNQSNYSVDACHGNMATILGEGVAADIALIVLSMVAIFLVYRILSGRPKFVEDADERVPEHLRSKELTEPSEEALQDLDRLMGENALPDDEE